MIAGNKGSGTDSRDNRHVNQTSDGSCDMESNKTDKSVRNIGVKIKEEPLDDTCTYGTSSCDVTGFIGQLSDYTSDNSGKSNLNVHSEPSSVFRDGTAYAVCIKYEPNASELAIDPVASVNDVNPGKSNDQTKDSNKLCYHEHQDNWQSYHENPVNSHYAGGDIKNASCKMQKNDTKINYGKVKCEISENPTQKNTAPYTNNNSRNSGHNHHDHKHIFSVSYEKISGSDKIDNSQEQQNITRKVFKCDICSYSITMPFDSEANYRKDTEMKQYKCDMCSYSTVNPRNLAYHHQNHKGEKLYKCRSDHQVVHQRKHTGEIPYKCNVCSYRTGWRSALAVHKRKHTGEIPYKCDVCSYSTKWSNELVMHKRKHTGEKPYKCDVCSYSTSRSDYLVVHQRKHTGEKPYMCDVCSYTTISARHLRSHKRNHTAEKLYKCDMCSYSTVWRSALVVHNRKHTVEKPYMCDVCNYTTFNTSNLRSHKRSHTAKKPYYM